MKTITQTSPSTNSIGILFPETTIDDQTIIDIWNAYILSPEIKDKIFTFDYYEVKENDRWDIISEKLYGNRSLWWLLALTNDIDDPFELFYSKNIPQRIRRLKILKMNDATKILNDIRKYTFGNERYKRSIT